MQRGAIFHGLLSNQKDPRSERVAEEDPMLERTSLMGLLAAGLSLAACSETPLEPTDAMAPVEPVFISTAPDPVYAVPSTGMTFVEDDQVREYAFLASFHLILRGNPEREIGVSVSSDSILLQQLLTTPVVGPGGGVDRERYDYESRAEGDRIEPGGETTRAFDVWYTLPSGRREAIINITLNFVDDLGITFERVQRITVEPSQP